MALTWINENMWFLRGGMFTKYRQTTLDEFCLQWMNAYLTVHGGARI